MNIKSCSEYDADATSKVALIYHCIKYIQNYTNLDCANKFASMLLSDYSVASM